VKEEEQRCTCADSSGRPVSVAGTCPRAQGAVPHRAPAAPPYYLGTGDRAARQRWRERKRVGDAAQRAAARYEEAQPPDGLVPAAARETAS
jgi:hypothetical protein